MADALVELGVPFREGHHIVGALVARAEAAGVELTELSDSDIAAVLAESADPVARGAASDPEVGAGLRTAACLENALARPMSSAARRRRGCTPSSGPMPCASASPTETGRGPRGRRYAGSTRSRETAMCAPSTTTSAGTGWLRKSGIDSL